MIVKEVAALNVKSCSPDTDLASAAKIMWDCDCGAVPVVNEGRSVVGMLTDRDICIAAATRAAAPSQIQVRDVMSKDTAVCAVEDDVLTALKTMKDRRVRRLPVVDGRGQLAGIISLNDVVMRTGGRAAGAVPSEVFLDTLKAISAHTHQPVSA
jgi:CBS domain-containing protein